MTDPRTPEREAPDGAAAPGEASAPLPGSGTPGTPSASEPPIARPRPRPGAPVEPTLVGLGPHGAPSSQSLRAARAAAEATLLGVGPQPGPSAQHLPVSVTAEPTLLGVAPQGASGGSAKPALDDELAPATPEADVAIAARPSNAESAGTHSGRRPSYAFLGAIALVTLALDLGSKAWAERRLDAPDGYFHPVVLIKNHLDFVLAKNSGGAWGLLQDAPEYVRRPFFLLVSALAITFIVSLYRRLVPEQWAMRWGLPLVLGGALGNLVDRIRYSYVIDFIHAHASWGGRDHSWPTFNVADIAICVGVGFMAIDMFTSASPSPAKTANAP